MAGKSRAYPKGEQPETCSTWVSITCSNNLPKLGFKIWHYLVNICARLVDALDEELDELVDLHPVVADVTQLESVVEVNMS